jgi:hypothetical protein
MAIRKTVISSFYNESYMLPWWLKHHRKIFDHGVLFNNRSTDDSVVLVKRYCPTWEVIHLPPEGLRFTEGDAAMMAIERVTPGYKITLTTAEFFMDGGIDAHLKDEPTIIAIPEVIMADCAPEDAPTQTRALVKQKRMGVLVPNVHRIFHNHPDGQYSAGRHSSFLPGDRLITDSCIFWYKHGPWTEEFIQRKLGFIKTVRPEDLVAGQGGHYLWTREEMDTERHKFLSMEGYKQW